MRKCRSYFGLQINLGKKMQKKNLIAGMFGNLLECYDFSIYAFLAPIFASIFFPNKNPIISLLLAFSVFALSFLVRPLGGIFFGYIGDHFGRKRALIVSIIAMSLPTLLLGLLPSYTAIGLWAPILLTLLRLIQGLAVSGEITTAVSYLVEHAPHNRRGLIGSLSMSSACAGTVLSAAIAAIITASLTPQQLAHWGWRIPFIFGGLLGVIGLVIRLSAHETLLYQKAQKTIKPSLIQHLRTLEYNRILVAVLLTCTYAMSYYFLISYCNAFLIKSMGQSANNVMLISFICNVVLMILLPTIGSLSDKLGRKPILICGMLGIMLFIHPVFWLLQQPGMALVFLGELILAIFVATIVATIPTTIAEMFEVQNRNSSVALSYNISLALFGGTIPLVSLKLIASTNNLYAPAWYLLAGACISFVTLLTIKESYQHSLA